MISFLQDKMKEMKIRLKKYRIIISGIVIIALFCVGIQMWLFNKNYEFDFTPQYLYMKTGIFSLSETHMPYNTIQDVK